MKIGDYHTVKSDITKRIARENSENARLIKAAKAKKDQASAFANKVRHSLPLSESSFVNLFYFVLFLLFFVSIYRTEYCSVFFFFPFSFLFLFTVLIMITSMIAIT